MVTLKSNELTAIISKKGAEIQSVKSKNGTEFMWCGDEKVWSGRAPILFPICGFPLFHPYKGLIQRREIQLCESILF